MARFGDKLKEGTLWQRNCAELISQLGDLLNNGSPSGVYTPTTTNVANISSSSASQAQYMRVGSVVTVSGYATLDPVAGSTLTHLGLSIPIASNFAAAEDCGGVAFDNNAGTSVAAIFADGTNDRVSLYYTSVGTAALSLQYIYMYRII